MYYPRLLEDTLTKLSKHFKIVLITGARQVGKSTLLKHLYPNVQSYVFDPISDLWNARRDPDLFLKNIKLPAILDEIQYSAEVLPCLKRIVDTHDEKGIFFLTGSQNFSVLKNAAESLAGRVSIIELKGITPFERAGIRPWLGNLFTSPETLFQKFNGTLSLKESLYELILQGSLPEAVQLPFDILDNYHSSYLRTYLERDIRLLENVKDLTDFERFVTLLSSLTAQEINNTQLGREIGISPITAQKWLNMLMHGYQWLSLSSYSGNAIKRLSKKAKGHFTDTGLACHLLGITSSKGLARHPLLGSLFESYCINMLDAINQSLPNIAKMSHFRTHNGAEVDLIFETNGLCFPIEIKCKTQINIRDAKGIMSFMDTFPNLNIPLGIVLHAGEECYYLKEKILAMPWLSMFTD